MGDAGDRLLFDDDPPRSFLGRLCLRWRRARERRLIDRFIALAGMTEGSHALNRDRLFDGQDYLAVADEFARLLLAFMPQTSDGLPVSADDGSLDPLTLLLDDRSVVPPVRSHAGTSAQVRRNTQRPPQTRPSPAAIAAALVISLGATFP